MLHLLRKLNSIDSRVSFQGQHAVFGVEIELISGQGECGCNLQLIPLHAVLQKVKVDVGNPRLYKAPRTPKEVSGLGNCQDATNITADQGELVDLHVEIVHLSLGRCSPVDGL